MGNTSYLGTALVRLIGNPIDQSISGADGVDIPNLEIATGANSVTMAGSPQVAAGTGSLFEGTIAP